MKFNATTSNEAIKESGLDWTVGQTPVLFEGNGLKEFTGKVVNYRQDNGQPLGIVGSGYKLVQNSTGFAFLDSFVGSQIEMFVNAGMFGGGKKVYIQAKLPGDMQFAGNRDDRGDKLVTFISSFDGSLPVSALFTPIRIVCTNTLNGALKSTDQVSSKHTASLNLDAMRNRLGILNQRFDMLTQMSEKLAAIPFREADMKPLLIKSGLIVTDNDEMKTRSLNILNDVTGLFAGLGKGSDMAGSKGTAWGAYNAITEYVDYKRSTKGDNRYESALIGSGAKAKQAALDVLLAA